MKNAVAIMVFSALFMFALYLSYSGYIPKWAADIVILAAGIYIYIESFNKYKKLRAVRDTATSKIGSMPLGFVEVYGKARRLPGLFDIYHYLSVRERSRRSSFIPSFMDATPRFILKAQPFYIEDETGTVYVDPFDAEIIVKTKRWSDGSYIYAEAEIKDGDFVYCLGTAVKEKASDIAAEINKALKEARQDKRMMLERFDTNSDGQISQEEWDAARKTLEKEITDKILNPKNESIISIERGKENPIFIVSNKNEKELIRQHFFHTILIFAAGIAVMVFALFHILTTVSS
ncbi:MAG: hypothetical protein FWH43_02300 [Endomicrobia bacterium]|nr:hypothetical protein [Endomicrobiia bacterium]